MAAFFSFRCLYNQDERYGFGKLIKEYIHIIDKQLNFIDWYDGLGEYYEILASNYKQSALGQFFTPSAIVDLMTKISNTDEQTGKRINDCACGSGRMLISHHVKNLGNYYFGEDIDRICCKMTCLNMVLHACVGEVVNHDSLSVSSYFAGWKINEFLNLTGQVSIKPMRKEESIMYQSWQNRLIEICEPTNQNKILKQAEIINEKKLKQEKQVFKQLSFF